MKTKNTIQAGRIRRDTKRQFMKKGTCSRALFFILDREFGHIQEEEEQAAELLAGGILQQGYQCGLLWGSVFALGAEANRRWPDRDMAIGMAVHGSRHLQKAFVRRAGSPDCEEITRCDWQDKLSIAKYMLTGKFISCFRLADKWAPEAMQAVAEGLALDPADLPPVPLSCAAEVIRLMGGGEPEQVIAAGLAGGVGLSGGGCGALAAAVWMSALFRIREKTYKISFSDPVSGKILQAFLSASDFELECLTITGKKIETVSDHSDFIRTGGCDGLLRTLAAAGAR